MKIAIIGDHNYAKPVTDYLESVGAFVQRYSHQDIHKDALRVQKRFHSQDIGSSKQRFQDLFRVTFAQNPEKEISKQLQGDGKEVFEKLTPFELDYLKSSFEGFSDFDLVVSLPIYAKAGTSGLACVGESQLDDIIYLPQNSTDQLQLIEQITCDPKVFEIAIIGDQIEVESLGILEKWLVNGQGSKRVFGVTSHTEPLSFWESKKLQEFESLRINEFETRLESWQKLEDYEKVKIPMPAEPVGCWVYFAGHELSVVSKLSDQDRLFITCEMSPYQTIISGRGEQNSKYPLKTVAVDKLVVAKGFTENLALENGLRKPIIKRADLDHNDFEPGFIKLDSSLSCESFIQDMEYYLNYYFVKNESL